MLRKSWFGGVFKPKNLHSLEHLRYLYSVLSKNQTVSDNNRGLLVETLRSIAEILIWGDQNDSSVFDFFLEKNMLSFFLRIMKQKCGSYVCVQLLQTLNILFENIRNETSLYYLLSNNHVNSIIVHKFDFSDEEVMAYYISFLKTLSFKLNSHTIHFFYNEHTNDFPLYTEAIKFFNHPESMVRIAVRTLTLNVYRINDQSMLQFIRDRTAAPYFSNLVWFIGNHILELDACVRDDIDHDSRDRLSGLVAEHLDHLHYLNDILRLHITPLNHLLAHHLLHRLLLPLLVHSLLPPDSPSHGAPQQVGQPPPSNDCTPQHIHSPCISPSSAFHDSDSGAESPAPFVASRAPRTSKVVSLFLLAQVFLILSFPPLVRTLAHCLLHAGVGLLRHEIGKTTCQSGTGFVPPEETLEKSLLSHCVSSPRRSAKDSSLRISAGGDDDSPPGEDDRGQSSSKGTGSGGDLDSENSEDELTVKRSVCTRSQPPESSDGSPCSAGPTTVGACRWNSDEGDSDGPSPPEEECSHLNITDEEKQQLLAYRLPSCCLAPLSAPPGSLSCRPFLQSVLEALDCHDNDYTALFSLCLLYALGHNPGFSKRLLCDSFNGDSRQHIFPSPPCQHNCHTSGLPQQESSVPVGDGGVGVRCSKNQDKATVTSCDGCWNTDGSDSDGRLPTDGPCSDKDRGVSDSAGDEVSLSSRSLSSYNSVLVEKMLHVISLSAQYNSKVRVVTLEIAVQVLKQVVGAGGTTDINSSSNFYPNDNINSDHNSAHDPTNIVDHCHSQPLTDDNIEGHKSCGCPPRSPTAHSSSSFICNTCGGTTNAFPSNTVSTPLPRTSIPSSEAPIRKSSIAEAGSSNCNAEARAPAGGCTTAVSDDSRCSRTSVSGSTRNRPVSGNRAALTDEHLAVLEGAREEATLVLRNFYKSEEMFLDLFEDEWNHISGGCSSESSRQSESLRVEYLLQDSNILLPPTATPLTGIHLNKRRPCGEVERARRAMRIFFLVRSACLLMRGEQDLQLPLTRPAACVRVGEVLDLNNSDLIACVVITREGERTQRFMVIDVLQLILVEPDQRRLGWGVAMFVAFLQDLEVTGDKDDSRVLHLTQHRPAAAVTPASSSRAAPLQPLLAAKFIFDDHIRCMAAKQRLCKGRHKARQRKLHQIARLLELPSHLQPCPSPPSHALSTMRQEAQHHHRRSVGSYHLRGSTGNDGRSGGRSGGSGRYGSSGRVPGRASQHHGNEEHSTRSSLHNHSNSNNNVRVSGGGGANSNSRQQLVSEAEEIQLEDIVSVGLHPVLRRL